MYEVYGKPTCNKCVMTKKLLDDLEVEYVFVDLGTSQITKADMDRWSGKDLRALPQIFIREGAHSQYFGEYEDLVREYQEL